MSFEEVHERISQITTTEHNQIVNYIHKYQHSIDLAEECVQTAYLQALDDSETIRDPEKLKSWIITVAKRTAIKQIEDHNRIVKACIRWKYYSLCFELDDILVQIFLADTMSKVLKKFPIYYGDVMRLRYSDGFSFPKIGNILKISPEAARSAHHRVKQELCREIRLEREELV